MQLNAEQLDAVLAKGLHPIYVLGGEEPLQLNELADAIRAAARAAGFSAREIFSVATTGFDWGRLPQSANTLSLFDDKKLIDVRLSGSGPGAEGSKALVAYSKRLPENTLLLVITGKLDKKTIASSWVQALDKVGVVIPVWPLEGQDLLKWLGQRLQRRGLVADHEGIQLLAERVEGNLLAAAQEVEKLYVLYGAGMITSGQILAAVADNSRYDVFNLVDTLLSANVVRSAKILTNLRAEGIAAPVVLWALAREARLLSLLKQGLASGQTTEAAFNQQRVFSKRRTLVSKALKRLGEADINAILLMGAKADKQIKGQQSGDAWETLLHICLLFASVKIAA